MGYGFRHFVQGLADSCNRSEQPLFLSSQEMSSQGRSFSSVGAQDPAPCSLGYRLDFAALPFQPCVARGKTLSPGEITLCLARTTTFSFALRLVCGLGHPNLGAAVAARDSGTSELEEVERAGRATASPAAVPKSASTGTKTPPSWPQALTCLRCRTVLAKRLETPTKLDAGVLRRIDFGENTHDPKQIDTAGIDQRRYLPARLITHTIQAIHQPLSWPMPP